MVLMYIPSKSVQGSLSPYPHQYLPFCLSDNSHLNSHVVLICTFLVINLHYHAHFSIAYNSLDLET